MPLEDEFNDENDGEIQLEEDKEPFVTVDVEYRGGKIMLSTGPAAQSLHEKSYFGTKLPNQAYELDPLETLLLLERKRIRVIDPTGKEIVNQTILADAAKNDPRIWVKYLVYRDLRSRGYIVRNGYGEGIDFRVYPRGSAREEDIAKFFVVILAEGEPVRLEILDRITKQTVQARKELILAIIDRLGDPTYYELEQFKLTPNDKLQVKW
jgi:tRNA-intron endonuclease